MSLDSHTSLPHSPASSLIVRHEPAAALYVREFLVQLGDDEVFVDCSSGIVHEAAGAVLPVHTRLALSPGGLRRLNELLTRALAELSSQPAPAARGNEHSPGQLLAQFPSLGSALVPATPGTAPCQR